MGFHEIDEFMSLKLSNKDINLLSGGAKKVRRKASRPGSVAHGSAAVPLKVSAEIRPETLAVLVTTDPTYVQWLRVTLLRVLIKTPALGRLKGSVNFELSQTFEFLGFENFEEFAASRTLSQIGADLAPILTAWESALDPERRFPAVLRANLQALASIVGLGEIESDLLGFGVLIHSENTLETGCNLLGGHLTGFNLERVLAPILGHKPAMVAHALQRSAKLATTGLLSVEISAQYGLLQMLDLMTPTFASRMLMPQTDIRDVVEAFVRMQAPGHLTPMDYEHAKDNLGICRSLVVHGLQHREGGTNILIYGKPGTGKTEFARMLARELQCQLLEISPTNLAGDPVAPVRRIRGYRIAQAFFKQAPAVILFDECEEILNPSHLNDAGDDATNIPRKSFLNKLLETNEVPTIWIANSIRGFDEAYLRRFSLCFEMASPPHDLRLKMLAKAFNGRIGTATQVAMARHKEATPALFMQAAKVVATLADTNTGFERDQLALHVMNNTLRAQAKTEIIATQDVGFDTQGFEPAWVNSEVDLSALADALVGTRSGRLCLYGPPGTGKTAFGKWLAEKLDVPHLVLKASELLSPYLGETELNMADAFETARRQKAVLQFDEVDSFLQDRQQASKPWEITQVNEMLTQMEAYQGVFIASTNLFEHLDEASLRRFDMAIKFDFLKAPAAWSMFAKTCEMLHMDLPAPSLYAGVTGLGALTPGDFEQVVRRSRLVRPFSAEDVLSALESAVRLKKGSASRRPAGFLCTL